MGTSLVRSAATSQLRVSAISRTAVGDSRNLYSELLAGIGQKSVEVRIFAVSYACLWAASPDVAADQRRLTGEPGGFPGSGSTDDLVEVGERDGGPAGLLQGGAAALPGEGAGSGTGRGDGADIVSKLVDLGSADMDPTRRAMLGLSLYSAALAIPGWPEVSQRFARLKADPHTRIGQREVDAVTTITDHLSGLDDTYGGRAVRPMAAAFLVNTIAPYLRAEAREDIRIQMLQAAADHCYLTGYMAADEGIEGLAQHYYLQALDLAGHSGDHLTYCTTLRGMSVQAVDLRHSLTALHLAEAAAAASPNAGPRMRAFLAGQQAHAAAQDGDKVIALAKLREAETALDKAESRAKALGSYDPAAMSYHISQVRFELGDLPGSIAAMEQSDRIRPPAYRRVKVRNLGLLAERKLAAGQLEEACRDWARVLDDYPGVQSGWCDRRYTTMMSELGRFQRNPHARELYERGRAFST